METKKEVEKILWEFRNLKGDQEYVRKNAMINAEIVILIAQRDYIKTLIEE